MRRKAQKIAVRICLCENGEIEVVVADDGNEERRHGTIEALDRRAQTLSGQAVAERVENGTVVRVTLPAYAAQGYGAHVIEKIEGSYSNVVGLPMEKTVAALAEFGIKPRTRPVRSVSRTDSSRGELGP